MDEQTLLARILRRQSENRSIASVFASPRDLIDQHGFARYEELKPYKVKEYIGPYIVSSYFRDIWNRSPTCKAEMIHAVSKPIHDSHDFVVGVHTGKYFLEPNFKTFSIILNVTSADKSA